MAKKMNLYEKCCYCVLVKIEHDTPYMDCGAPEDYRFKREECPYFRDDSRKEDRKE